MLKVNFDKLQMTQSPSEVQLSLKDKYEILLDTYIHEPNTKLNRECIKNCIEDILIEAKENAIKDGKYYIVNGGRKVYPADLNPLVFVNSDYTNTTCLNVSFNYDGGILIKDIYNEI